MDRNLVVALLAVGRAWSLSARRAWIEILFCVGFSSAAKSLSARRAWIEIPMHSWWLRCWQVALRKESVDRNLFYGDDLTFSDVALRKESVDRNPKLYKAMSHVRWSLSARRAWIEISIGLTYDGLIAVALRKESVDRNDAVQVIVIVMDTSLSARRAWIEIWGR